VRLLETTLIRVGNEEYAKENHSYGLTTLLQRHVDVTGAHIHFRFRGKSGVKHDIDLDDARLAEIVRQCHELPGQELFQYLTDSGDWHDVDSADVNDYLHEIAGEEFTAKDFRTWSGTVLAATALAGLAGFTSAAQAKKNIVRAVESVAHKLGNTKAVCRKCYVHPAVFEGYLDGTLVESLNGGVDAAPTATRCNPSAADLRPDERRVLTFLRHRSAGQQQADVARSDDDNEEGGLNGPATPAAVIRACESLRFPQLSSSAFPFTRRAIPPSERRRGRPFARRQCQGRRGGGRRRRRGKRSCRCRRRRGVGRGWKRCFRW
jgi:DNA topoisomerase-1